jgi:hypothetical protein
MTKIIVDKIVELAQKPFFWAILAAFFSSFINILLFRLNSKTFKLLYEKPHIQINSISIEPRHSSPQGMIPDGSYIDIEVINPSSFKNVITNIRISFFPFIRNFSDNSANLELHAFSRLRIPQIIESDPVDKHKNKILKIVLKDIKNRKIVKYILIRKKK